MLSGGFKLLTKDDHLLIKEDVPFLPSCKAVSSSAIALPYVKGILEERDGKGSEVGRRRVVEERDGREREVGRRRVVEEGFEQFLVFNGKPLGAFPIWHAAVSFGLPNLKLE